MKTVIFDLDDTLLHDDRTISSFTVDAFQRLHHAGYRFIAASGRAQFSMKPYMDQLPCISAYIACNGAEIWDAASHVLLHQELIPVDVSREIAQFAENHDCYAHVYDKDSFYYNKHCQYSVLYAASSRLTGVYAGKLSEYITEPRNKIILIDDEATIQKLYAEAKQQFSGKASVTCSKPIYLEFNPVNTSKGNALAFLAEKLGFQMKDVIAFGDSLNDLSMLRNAGLSVAVSNGWKAVKADCDAICASNNEDGPARFLLQYYLSGEVSS